MVYVQLFGVPKAKVKEKWYTFQCDKRHQLLAYLAYRGDWVSREHLAYLFYPDTPSDQARHSLRSLYSRMQSLEWLTLPEANGQQMCWQVETDTAQFVKAVANNDLEQAVSLYNGTFLQGLEGDEPNEFINWLESERTKLHSKWREATLRYAEQLSTLGQSHKATNILAKLLEADELDEEALKHYMTVLAQGGKAAQALEAYKEFRDRLKDELDLEPTSSTEHLANNIRSGIFAVETRRVGISSSVTTAERPKRTLPTPAQPIVGRELELSHILHRFSEEGCRLLTLVGTGGIGKTRLALEAAHD
jgi:DNA-binding SARP family transcriptional activator